MRKSKLNIWKIITIVILITWLLWFFEIDVRDIKERVTNAFEDNTNDYSSQIYSNQIQSESNNQPTITKPISKEDIIMKKCLDSYNTCSAIGKKKYEVDFKILEKGTFEEGEAAQDFYDTWAGFGAGDLAFSFTIDELEFDESFPISMIAIQKTIYGGGESAKLPEVIICTSEGELLTRSKVSLGCR